MTVKTITDGDFKNKIENSDKTVIVSFSANQSAPSGMIESSLNAAATEFADQAEIYRMDTDSNFVTPTAYKIVSVPTLLIFKKGRLLSSYVGAASKTTIRQLLAVSL
jgi:thioredoxin 1